MPKFVMKEAWPFEATVVVREPGSGHLFDFVGVFELQPVDASGSFNWVAGFKGWRGISDPSAPNGEFPVTDANRAKLLALPHVRLAIMTAYFEEANKVAEKNAVTPAAPGPAPRVN